MGIYTDLSIFGIRIYNISYDDDIYNLFQRKYDVIMSNEKIKEAYLFYEELYDKQDIFLQIYTETSSTYDEGVFMMWYSITTNDFLEKFGIGNMKICKY
jgi:hypothetical protein